NTAIAYAMLGAAAGIGVTVCVPRNASAERQALLDAYGAEVVLTDPLEGSDGAIREARRLAAGRPGRFWYADQYNHPANPRAHYLTTAEELWRQTRGRITHLVAGLGTTGTLVGTGRRLKELNPEIEVVAVQPDGPFHGLEGLKHLATTIVPGIYDPELPDRTEFVSTEDAEDAVRQLAKQAGLLAGWSTGGTVEDGRKVAVLLVPLVNQRTDAARNRYLIDPESFRRAQEKLDRDGLEVIGVYHSHPDHAAAPSTFDREHAWPWLSYVIVG